MGRTGDTPRRPGGKHPVQFIQPRPAPMHRAQGLACRQQRPGGDQMVPGPVQLTAARIQHRQFQPPDRRHP